MKKVVFLVLVAICATAPSLSAQPYDYAVAGPRESACVVSAILDPSSGLQWIVNGLRGTGGTLANAVAPAPGGGVIAAVPSGDTFRVDSVTPAGAPHILGSAPPGYSPLALVASKAGAIFVLARETAGGETVIVAFGPDGAVTGVLPLPVANAQDIDLAADQCTLFVAANDRVARYNVCTASLLPDFAAGSGMIAVRILPDGGAVVLRGDQAPARFSAAGTLTQTYALPAQTTLSAIAVADAGARVIGATRCTEEIFAIDLATAAVTRLGFDLYELERPTSIVPYTSWTAALGMAHLPTAPTASEMALAVLAAAVACAALLRLR
jgi:hypothetical protein